MICKNCKFYTPIKSADNLDRGICQFFNSYQPTIGENKCGLEKEVLTPLTCSTCQHFEDHDTACMSVLGTDSIIHRNYTCGGYEPTILNLAVDALVKGSLQGAFDLNECCQQIHDLAADFINKYNSR